MCRLGKGLICPYIEGGKTYVSKQIYNITLSFRPLVLEMVSRQFVSIQEKYKQCIWSLSKERPNQSITTNHSRHHFSLFPAKPYIPTVAFCGIYV